MFLPRAVGVGEIRRVRRIPQRVGWLYAPDIHGRRPCACPVCLAPGTYGAAAVRRRFPLDPPPPTKPELMAALRAAVSPQNIIDALWDLSGRRRGGAEELAYLVEHPDAEVRDTLAEILRDYRGRAARDLRHRLGGGAGLRLMTGRADPEPTRCTCPIHGRQVNLGRWWRIRSSRRPRSSTG